MTLLGFKTILHKKCRSGKNSESPTENSWVLDLCPAKWKQISKSLLPTYQIFMISDNVEFLPPIFYAGFHGNAILNFINIPKASTHYGEYSYDVWWKKSIFFLNPSFFNFHGNCGKVCPTDSDFFLLISCH